MTERHDTNALAEVVRSGELNFETALEEALGDFDHPLDDVFRILGYFNLGDRDRTVDVGIPEKVGEFVARHGLQPFVALLNDLEDFQFFIGDIVSYGGRPAGSWGGGPFLRLPRPATTTSSCCSNRWTVVRSALSVSPRSRRLTTRILATNSDIVPLWSEDTFA